MRKWFRATAAAVALAAATAASAVSYAAADWFNGQDNPAGPFIYFAAESGAGLEPGDCGALQCLVDGGSGFYKAPGADVTGVLFTWPADRLVAVSTTSAPVAVLTSPLFGRGSATVKADYLLSLAGADLDVSLVDLAIGSVVAKARLNGMNGSASFAYDFTGVAFLALVFGDISSTGLPGGFDTPGASGDFAAAFDFSVSVVPEPGAWALMIVGFGAVGLAMRRRPIAANART